MSLKKIDCSNCHSSDFRLLGICSGNRGARFVGSTFSVVVCQKCGLTFINPQPEEADYMRYYATMNYAGKTGKYNMDRERLLEEKRVQQFYVNFLSKHIDANKFPKVLDYGCGYGTFLHYLRTAGFVPEGLDAAVDVAKKAEEMFGFPVHSQSFRENSLPDEAYDVVTGLDVIEHSTNPRADMREAFRILKPGGYLYFTTPNFQEVILRKGWNKYFKFVHTHYFTLNTLSSLMEQAGFDVAYKWVIPPFTKYSNLLFPENFTHGTLCVIGKKAVGKVASEPYGDDPSAPFRWVRKAKMRDRKYQVAKRLIFSPAGLPLRFLRKKIGRKNPYEPASDSPFYQIP